MFQFEKFTQMMAIIAFFAFLDNYIDFGSPLAFCARLKQAWHESLSASASSATATTSATGTVTKSYKTLNSTVKTSLIEESSDSDAKFGSSSEEKEGKKDK